MYISTTALWIALVAVLLTESCFGCTAAGRKRKRSVDISLNSFSVDSSDSIGTERLLETLMEHLEGIWTNREQVQQEVEKGQPESLQHPSIVATAHVFDDQVAGVTSKGRWVLWKTETFAKGNVTEDKSDKSAAKSKVSFTLVNFKQSDKCSVEPIVYNIDNSAFGQLLIDDKDLKVHISTLNSLPASHLQYTLDRENFIYFVRQEYKLYESTVAVREETYTQSQYILHNYIEQDDKRVAGYDSPIVLQKF